MWWMMTNSRLLINNNTSVKRVDLAGDEFRRFYAFFFFDQNSENICMLNMIWDQ